MQLHDLRGNTVTSIDLTNNTASAWCGYDEFGNPDGTNPANTANINYTTYGQAERATNSTGLILMGARVYNPETNQFTSPDPVKGGNENSYTYPNDPVDSSDLGGLYPSVGIHAPPLPPPIPPEADALIKEILKVKGSKILSGEFEARILCDAISAMFCGRVPEFSSDRNGKFLTYDILENGKRVLRVRVSFKDYKLLKDLLVVNFESGFKVNPKLKPGNNAHVIVQGNGGGGSRAGMSELAFIRIQVGGGGVGRVY